MTLQDRIKSILGDKTLDYGGKARALARIVTTKELDELLPRPADLPRLKEPIRMKEKGLKTLNLSIKPVYYNQILGGSKKIEYRDYTEYYKQRCTYQEGGRLWLVPYDALVLHEGAKRSMTVRVVDITCDGAYFMFHLGDVLYASPE